MRPTRAPGSRKTEDIVRHREESRRLNKESATNSRRRKSGSMPKETPSCEFRAPGPPGMNICRAGLYGGKVTDGVCRLCIAKGNKPQAIVVLPRLAIGDLAEKLLTNVGVTKERVKKLTRTGCGCEKRQQWLNEWGFRTQEQIERGLNVFARWCGIG